MRKFVLPLLASVLLTSCDMPGDRIRQDTIYQSNQKAKLLEGKQVLKVTRLDPCHVIVVCEDGTTLTFYGFSVRNGGDVERNCVGVK